MEEKAKVKQKFCGNCGNHNVYRYPTEIFCSLRFRENKDPIMQTLWCCEEWTPSSQECYCIEETLKRQSKK